MDLLRENVVIRYAIEIFSYICAGILLLSRPLRTRILLRQAGNCLLPLTRRCNMLLYVAVLFAALCMLAVLRFRTFDFFPALVLRFTALLALELAGRDAVYRGAAGVYENVFIADGRKILTTEILSVPLSDGGTENDKTLTLLSDKSGKIVINFDSTEDCVKSAQILKKRLDDKRANC